MHITAKFYSFSHVKIPLHYSTWVKMATSECDVNWRDFWRGRATGKFECHTTYYKLDTPHYSNIRINFENFPSFILEAFLKHTMLWRKFWETYLFVWQMFAVLNLLGHAKKYKT